MTPRDDILLADEIRQAFDLLPKPRILVINPGVGEHFKASLSGVGIEYREDASCPRDKVYVIDPNEIDRWPGDVTNQSEDQETENA